MSVALRLEPASDFSRLTRKCPRFSVSWPVVLEVGKRLFLLQAVDVSGGGAKVRPTEQIKEGSVAHVHLRPPTGPPLDVRAIVWRVDPDGLALRFTDDNQSRLAILLAQLGGTPPEPWATSVRDLDL